MCFPLSVPRRPSMLPFYYPNFKGEMETLRNLSKCQNSNKISSKIQTLSLVLGSKSLVFPRLSQTSFKFQAFLLL